MKEKLVAFFLGLFLGVIICSFYHFFIKTDENIVQNKLVTPNVEMTDERLNETAERLGISKEELQKEIDSGKDIRTIMQERGATMGGGMRGTGDFKGGENQ